MQATNGTFCRCCLFRIVGTTDLEFRVRGIRVGGKNLFSNHDIS
ncbi:MAG: hypothetical protein JWP89_5729 [Schlesneria sp.]|nr:hypothetical protein [Schlesneria sp.]